MILQPSQLPENQGQAHATFDRIPPAKMVSLDLVPELWSPGQGTRAYPGQNMGQSGKGFGTCQPVMGLWGT